MVLDFLTEFWLRKPTPSGRVRVLYLQATERRELTGLGAYQHQRIFLNALKSLLGRLLREG